MDVFTGKILPEDPLPANLTDQQRLALSDHTSARLIWGEGNPVAPIFVILDNPGARETKEGRPFLCGTRETLQKGIHSAGLALETVYVSYLLKARPLKKYDKERIRRLALGFLLEQVRRHRPQVVVCLGDVVVKSYFGDRDISVKRLRGRIHPVHGCATITSYHPLAVRRRPVLYKYFVQDWFLAASVLQAAPL